MVQGLLLPAVRFTVMRFLHDGYSSSFGFVMFVFLAFEGSHRKLSTPGFQKERQPEPETPIDVFIFFTEITATRAIL